MSRFRLGERRRQRKRMNLKVDDIERIQYEQ